ncbi:MAG TPA: peptidoglycan-associated lipoprotein Pal [Longimicrobiales bacterium]|nr:peptidoglycan-associated lipoprotein Pal [Longimicrobiales bacterium]
MMRNVRTAALLVGVVALGACSKKQPEVMPQPAQPSTPTATQPSTPATPVRDDNAEREEALRRMRAVLEQVIYFDYDESSIRVDAQESLASKVPFLRQNPGIRIRIEGHADERGSVEYNLALGMRRANAVRDYLVGFGLDASRFDVFSFGEDRPAAQGSNEAAWAQNRRAEFRVTAGM